MDMEKRMAGDYEITQALRIGDKEIVLGRNRAAQPGQEFLCAFYAEQISNHCRIGSP